MNSPSVTSTNHEVCSLQIQMHEKIKYWDLSKTQERVVRCAINVMKKHIKLLSQKTCNSVILGYFLKYKVMKEVVLEMDIITTSFTKEIIRKNKCQMSFLEKLVFKQDVDKIDDNCN